jgi:hypothetical protein
MKINHLGLFWSIFRVPICVSSAVGQSGQNHKKADMSLKINVFAKLSVQIRMPDAILPLP